MASYKAPVNIHKLIAAVVPEPFCDLKARSRVKRIVREGLAKGNKNAYLDAAKEAEPAEYQFVDLIEMKYGRAFNLLGFKRPIEKHKLEYDSFGEGLEHIYFWLLDRMEYENMSVERLLDTFESSAGSGHFSEMGLKSARMQEEGMKMLGAANQVVKSIIQIIYDLKDFKLRLKIYADYRGKDNEKKHASLLSLKQIWMDNEEIKRGRVR